MILPVDGAATNAAAVQQPADQAAIDAAAAQLAAGGLVAFPTETVYGLGADAENPAAVASIYAAKGRPQDHPVIVHLAPGADLDYWATAIPAEARQLAAAFWPGPLTLILKRAAHIPDAVSGGQDTVGLRCPSHPVAIALLQAFKAGKGGLAAPSANKFGHVSPTTAAHVRDEFGDSVAVLDGGQSEVGIESTIVDLTRLTTHGPVLLRPGRISAEAVAGVIGKLPVAPQSADASAPRASGTLDSHYAPQTPVALQAPALLVPNLAKLALAGRTAALIHYSALADANVAVTASVRLPANPDGYAHALYAALRDMDQQHADVILVEAPPAGPAWLGVNDRLRRAAHGSSNALATLF